MSTRRTTYYKVEPSIRTRFSDGRFLETNYIGIRDGESIDAVIEQRFTKLHSRLNEHTVTPVKESTS